MSAPSQSSGSTYINRQMMRTQSTRTPVRKQVKCWLLGLAKVIGLFAAARWLTRRGVRILCYHGVWLGDDGFAGDTMFMAAQTFARRLEAITRLGYPVVTLEMATAGLTQEARLPPSPVVVTIDDGWFSTFSCMLPELKKRNMPATLYCDTEHLENGQPVLNMMTSYLIRDVPNPGEKAFSQDDIRLSYDKSASYERREAAVTRIADVLGVAVAPYLAKKVFDYMTPAQLAQSAAEGVDVQLHTHRHSLHDQSPAQIAQEIADNRRSLSRILGRHESAFRHFCYPSGITTKDGAQALAALGLRSSTTVKQGLAFPGDSMQLLPRILDSENWSMIEFEAELSGFAYLVRWLGGARAS